MPSKKPPAPPSTASKPSTRPEQRRIIATPPNSRQQPDTRWQRSKRHSWDGR